MWVAFEEGAALDPADRLEEKREEQPEHGVDADRAEDRAGADFGGADHPDQHRGHRRRQQPDLDDRAEAEPDVVAGDRRDHRQHHPERAQVDREVDVVGRRVGAGQRDDRGRATDSITTTAAQPVLPSSEVST